MVSVLFIIIGLMDSITIITREVTPKVIINFLFVEETRA